MATEHVAWRMLRVQLAERMGWTLDYLDDLAKNKSHEIGEIVAYLNAEAQAKELRQKAASQATPPRRRR